MRVRTCAWCWWWKVKVLSCDPTSVRFSSKLCLRHLEEMSSHLAEKVTMDSWLNCIKYQSGQCKSQFDWVQTDSKFSEFICCSYVNQTNFSILVVFIYIVNNLYSHKCNIVYCSWWLLGYSTCFITTFTLEEMFIYSSSIVIHCMRTI